MTEEQFRKHFVEVVLAAARWKDVRDGNEASVGPGHQARGCGQGSEDRFQQDPGGRSFRSQGSRFGADSGLPEWSYGELTMGIP